MTTTMDNVEKQGVAVDDAVGGIKWKEVKTGRVRRLAFTLVVEIILYTYKVITLIN